MAKALIAAVLVASLLPTAAGGNESDELNRVLNVAYCTARESYLRDNYCSVASQYSYASQDCQQLQRISERMQLYLAGTMSVRTIWSSQVGLALASGTVDLKACAAQAGPGATPAICQRMIDRCAEIDRILPY